MSYRQIFSVKYKMQSAVLTLSRMLQMKKTNSSMIYGNLTALLTVSDALDGNVSKWNKSTDLKLSQCPEYYGSLPLSSTKTTQEKYDICKYLSVTYNK